MKHLPDPTKYLLDHFKGLINRARAYDALGQIQDKAPLMIAFAEALLIGTFIISMIGLVIQQAPLVPFSALLAFKIGEGWGRFSNEPESNEA